MKMSTRLFIALAAFGVIMTFFGVGDWMCLSKEPKDITELWDYDYSRIKEGDHVCLDVTLVWDQIGSQISQSKTFGVTTSEKETGRYYLIPFCQDTDDGYIYPTPYLMARIPSQYNTLLDSQIEKTATWWETDGEFSEVPTCSLHLDGRIKKLPNDIRKQLTNSLDSGERLEDYMLPVLFEPIMAPGAVKGMSIAGILCLMATLVILALKLKSVAGSKQVDYGIPRSQGTAFTSQNGNTGNFGSSFANQQPLGGAGNAQSSFAGGQPQNTAGGNFGSSFAGGQPQNTAGGNFGSSFAGGQPQNTAGGNFGSSFAGGQPQNTAGGNFGSSIAGGQPAGGAGNMQSSFANTQPSPEKPAGSPYSTATLETTPLPYIPGISVGPAPSRQGGSSFAGPASQSGPSPMPGSAPLGPSSISGSEPLGPSSPSGPQPLGPSSVLGGEQSGSTSILGNTPAPAVSPVTSAVTESTPAAPAEEKTEEKKETQGPTEEEAAQLRAMAFATSQPAILPLGGGGANVQAASQPATLPLGVSPTTVSNHNFDIPVPQGDSEESGAPAQSPMGASPLYGAGPAQQPQSAAPTQSPMGASPLYGSGPAQQPQSTAPTQSPMGASPLYGTAPAAPAKPAAPEEDEHTPLYADNTEMKSVFKGAFANSNNNNNYN
ncbi:MAG: hypothetical protein J6X66_11165 [Lachnospiraceae bacterium]|nr:hypothetical protein [Lachnospiraceae bacterium]